MIKTLMLNQFVKIRYFFDSNPKVVSGLEWFVKVFFVITLLIKWVPFAPAMLPPNPLPGKLDISWIFAINQAVAQNLVFGREIIFTNGPYGALYTRLYHPATDVMMIAGSLLISLGYIVLVFLISRKTNLIWLCGLAFFITTTSSFDPLLRSYPFLFALTIYKIFFETSSNPLVKTFIWPALFVSLIPMGMLPLIKGTFLISVSVYIFLSVLMFLVIARKWEAGLLVIIPAFSLILFWMLAGQPMNALAEYFVSMVPIISGYTEAMSLPGYSKEIVVFVLASGLFIAVINFEKAPQIKNLLFISSITIAHLFLGFKAGFVRYDLGHLELAVQTLILTGAFLPFLNVSYVRKAIVFVITAFSWVILTPNISSIPQNVELLYKNSWHGFWVRVISPSLLRTKHNENLSVIQNEVNIPKLPGTVDIYSYRQIDLLTSNNTWSPRPVFQSYSAYTSELLQLNASHLMSNKAPDYLLFRVETIDGRLPSLDDGMSWPIIIEQYSIRSVSDLYVLLQKRNHSTSQESFPQTDVVYFATHQFGDMIDISTLPNPLLAEITIEPAFSGKLISLFYKLPTLRIKLELENGEGRDYRLIPSMTKTPFFLSPLVETNEDFILLATDDTYLASFSRVKNIRLEMDGSKGQRFLKWAWIPTYRIKLSTVNLEQDNTLANLLGFFSEIENAYSDSLPVVSGEPVNCEGHIDFINKKLVEPGSFVSVMNILSVSGWTAISTANDISPERIYIVLTDQTGNSTYIQSKKQNRPDVAAYFGKPGLSNAGYKTIVDVKNLAGIYTLGIARVNQGVLERCSNFTNTIEIKSVPVP